MIKFQTLKSRAMPLAIKDIDTDMIIPADFLTSTSREGYGKNVFRRLRDQDENFPMNVEKYKDARIIVADDNFGCGSSREHAVWALLGAGFKVIISKSFADIFFNNAAKNGLVLITLPEDVVDELLTVGTGRDLSLQINLESQTVTTEDGTVHHFEYDPFRKHCILNGLDDIDYIREAESTIKEYESKRNKNIYFSTTQ